MSAFGALVGPYARLRPGARLGAEVHIGKFVEVKNSTLAKSGPRSCSACELAERLRRRLAFGAVRPVRTFQDDRETRVGQTGGGRRLLPLRGATICASGL